MHQECIFKAEALFELLVSHPLNLDTVLSRITNYKELVAGSEAAYDAATANGIAPRIMGKQIEGPEVTEDEDGLKLGKNELHIRMPVKNDTGRIEILVINDENGIRLVENFTKDQFVFAESLEGTKTDATMSSQDIEMIDDPYRNKDNRWIGLQSAQVIGCKHPIELDSALKLEWLELTPGLMIHLPWHQRPLAQQCLDSLAVAALT